MCKNVLNASANYRPGESWAVSWNIFFSSAVFKIIFSGFNHIQTSLQGKTDVQKYSVGIARLRNYEEVTKLYKYRARRMYLHQWFSAQEFGANLSCV